jgi:Arc/MetJ-type ribon-helix-helix transcriptional regulator
MDVVLDPETEKLVQEELQSGRFKNAAALIGTALKHFLIAREFGEEYTRQEIEEKIARGISQLDRGEGVDGDAFFEELRHRGDELRRQRG